MSAYARASSNAMVSVVIDWPGQHEGMAELEKVQFRKGGIEMIFRLHPRRKSLMSKNYRYSAGNRPAHCTTCTHILASR